MRPLRATLRLQFHPGFSLDDAIPLLDGFAALGISHLYASPLFTARPGSSHGYDVVDPTRINPELGGEAALERLCAALHERDMGLIVDIVSNHMGIGNANPWWQDVLEWGRRSPYSRFFDIHWHSSDPLLRGQVLLPVLASDYGEALAGGRITLHYDAANGRFQAGHYDQRFPLCPSSYDALLEQADSDELQRLGRRFAELQRHPQARSLANGLCLRLSALLDPEQCQRILQPYRVADGENWWPLHRLLERQHYRLASWRTAADDINWRRFFDINELVGLRAERGEVFEAYHAKLFELVKRGLVDGVRIDHIDGLADPRAYCRRLSRRLTQVAGGRTLPLYVEKILAAGERLPQDWCVDGSTGYDFMNQVSLLQHDPAGEAPLRTLWHEVSGRSAQFEDEERDGRELVLSSNLAGDLETVAQGLWSIARADIFSRDLPLAAIRRALFQLVAAFPVYRTYAGVCGRNAADAEVFARARDTAAAHLSESDRQALTALDRWLGGDELRKLPPGRWRRLRRRMLARFQQLTGPAAAKSVEDTAFYRHGVLLSRNDVGFDPGEFSAPPEAFHAACQARLADFPDALLAGATHDHKRGEDSRARLAVLSERAPWYVEQVRGWRAMAAELRRDAGGPLAPSPGDELMLYQSLLGSWPLALQADDAKGLRAYHERLAQWQVKALREAKLRSSWSEPDQAYEAACAQFLDDLLLSSEGLPLRSELARAAHALMPAGALNGLAQTLVRLCVPGVPDIYQGSDFWDFSLVDPDNRRPVDYPRRLAALHDLPTLAELLPSWRDGRIKQALIARTLALRTRHPALLLRGAYLPLEVQGEQARQVLAFARVLDDQALVVVVPRLAAGLLGEHPLPQVPAQRWGDTRVCLPEGFAALYDVLAERDQAPGPLRLEQLLDTVPLGLLITTALAQEAQ
ncbi:MAG: Maltooligosyl trehalose synthase [Pseudomonas citronellolis]|nr:MAG: Maltooligosyl trehalose synthase [Pseudomonas citronellolis]